MRLKHLLLFLLPISLFGQRVDLSTGSAIEFYPSSNQSAYSELKLSFEIVNDVYFSNSLAFYTDIEPIIKFDRFTHKSGLMVTTRRVTYSVGIEHYQDRTLFIKGNNDTPKPWKMSPYYDVSIILNQSKYNRYKPWYWYPELFVSYNTAEFEVATGLRFKVWHK